MIDLYSFIDNCLQAGLSNQEALALLHKAEQEEQEAFLADYNSRPDVMEGWRQQDIIDMYRRER